VAQVRLKKKKGHIQGLFQNLKEAEIPLAVCILRGSGHAIGVRLEAWLQWMHPDAPAVLKTCAPRATALHQPSVDAMHAEVP
jgi:hypothetical protein